MGGPRRAVGFLKLFLVKFAPKDAALRLDKDHSYQNFDGEWSLIIGLACSSLLKESTPPSPHNPQDAELGFDWTLCPVRRPVSFLQCEMWVSHQFIWPACPLCQQGAIFLTTPLDFTLGPKTRSKISERGLVAPYLASSNLVMPDYEVLRALFADVLGPSQVEFQEHATNKDIGQYQVGVRFEPLDSVASMGDRVATTDSFIKTKHWSLAFTPWLDFSSAKKPSFRLDLYPRSDKRVRYVATPVDEKIHMHPIGVWTGCFQDVKELMNDHARGKGNIEYSPWFNNCQHWAATMLVLLEAQAAKRPGRSFKVYYETMHNKVLSALSKTGDSLYNKPNPLFRGGTATGVTVGTGLAGGLAVASTVTTAITGTVTLPAAGIAGLFGATVTETIAIGTIATAGATAAMVVGPVIGAAALGGAFIVALEASSWKDLTKFEDPRNTIPLDLESLRKFLDSL